MGGCAKLTAMQIACARAPFFRFWAYPEPGGLRVRA